MWTRQVLALAALAVLLRPAVRRQTGWLAAACVAIIVSIWIEKGLGMIVTGFVPSPLGHVTPVRADRSPRSCIALGIYGIGALIVTILYKIALSVRGEVA